MKLSDFDYTLPEELIAQTPLKERDQARLLVVDRESRTISHDIFANLEEYLPSQSMLVVNNSKVIPARLLGKKKRSGGNVEIFLLDKVDGHSYRVMMRPCRKIKDGDEIVFENSDIVATIVSKDKRIVRFNKAQVTQHLENIGHIPLPPYIKRKDTAEDHEYYQTVYARHAGSVAAPTAGLHFTKKLINEIKSASHEFEQVMLHVNYATFKPVEKENILDHQIHTEEYSISQNAWDAIIGAKRSGRKVVAVGTTSCRTLETAVRTNKLHGSTELFLYPGCSFKMVNALITNFHLPKSTLLMMVYAFGGTGLMKKAYQEAIKKKYRFYSYGDGMIIK